MIDLIVYLEVAGILAVPVPRDGVIRAEALAQELPKILV